MLLAAAQSALACAPRGGPAHQLPAGALRLPLARRRRQQPLAPPPLAPSRTRQAADHEERGARVRAVAAGPVWGWQWRQGSGHHPADAACLHGSEGCEPIVLPRLCKAASTHGDVQMSK